ncbi:hypothetical protein HJC23_012335 [Cyclotella cryptica]|uniref:Uncharacterized protein n=1 Tax=Cyclotella cryptica TaxID=29204 RepID=A0ABD3QDL9_9STRA|eukprot:CCRYP_006525-RA/>CCRYP_006525-RA protein AED:0.02 eAED:0.02 QI:234/1/1/1/1/1/2/76/1013
MTWENTIFSTLSLHCHRLCLISPRRSVVECCILAIIILLSMHCVVNGHQFFQHGAPNVAFSRECRQHRVRWLTQSVAPILELRGGNVPSDDHYQQYAHHITKDPLSSYRSNTRMIWQRSRLFPGAISLRGGVDDNKDEELQHDTGAMSQHELKASHQTNISAMPKNDVTLSDETRLLSSSTPKITTGSVEESGRFKALLSLFRPLSSSSSAAAAVPDRDQSSAKRIPHGPSGGGSTTLAANLDGNQDDSEFLMTSSTFSTTSTAETKATATNALDEVPNTTNFPTAFAINHGHSSASTKQLSTVGNGAEDGVLNQTKHNLTPVPYEKFNSSKESTVLVDDDVNHSAIALFTNETEKLVSNETSQSRNSTSESDELDFQTVNASVPIFSDVQPMVDENRKDYTSSGYWVGIDLISSFGLSSLSDDLKISKLLRPMRKAAAKSTGLHGFLSGKPADSLDADIRSSRKIKGPTIISIDEELGIHDTSATEAEFTARRIARPLTRRQQRRLERREAIGKRVGRRWGFRKRQQDDIIKQNQEYIIIPVLDESPDALERRRRKRVEEIDDLIKRGSARLLELQCEKDDLQRAPNPLFNYTKQYDASSNKTFGDVRTSREFNFPSSDLVNEYIEELVSNGRLIRLNHTDLWQSPQDNYIDDDEIVGDDLFTPSADARKLYQNLDQFERGMRKGDKKTNLPMYGQNSGGGSWLLRTGFGNGGSLGEKLGETIETQAYKAVCSSVMMVLARILSALHGINVMSHSDIRLYMERDVDLPPVDKAFGHMTRDNYAQHAIKTAIQKGSKKKRKHGGISSSHSSSSRRHGHELSDDAFLQRDAVVETLISHCQISAPLLKLFPIDWQRAIVGNIITLVTAIVSDFADGIHIQVLGHSLSFSFKPITEADLIQHIGVGGFRQNHRRSRPEEFEYAVWATAQDISNSLSFLDGWLGWLEKKIGGGILISQLSNLIARVVLTLIDEVLSGARLDLWSSQANGPRLYAALEYRSTALDTEGAPRLFEDSL